jgi:hypothetical protein
VAATVIGENAKAAWLPGIAGVRARARGMVRHAAGYAAAAVMVCAVGAASLQLVAQIASFPAPVAVTAFTLIAVALFHSLRRHRRAQARHRHGAGARVAPGGMPRQDLTAHLPEPAHRPGRPSRSDPAGPARPAGPEPGTYRPAA